MRISVATTLLFGLIILSAIFAAASASSSSVDFSWVSSSSSGGLIGDELDDEDLMDSEINRRILATTKYVSYGAMRRNTVPCSRRGASYYNCRPGAQANPYSRGCSAISRCRR